MNDTKTHGPLGSAERIGCPDFAFATCLGPLKF